MYEIRVMFRDIEQIPLTFKSAHHTSVYSDTGIVTWHDDDMKNQNARVFSMFDVLYIRVRQIENTEPAASDENP